MNNIAAFYVVRGTGLLFFAWLFSWYIYPVLKEIIRIQRTPTDYISALPFEGQVEVVGKAEGKTILSPFAQKACVLWQVDIQRYGNKFDGPLVTIHTERSPESFSINDGTGKIQISPAGAYLILSDKRGSSSLFPMDFQSKNILEKLGVNTTDYLARYRALRVYERFIEPAEEIYILGEIEYRNGVRTIATADDTPAIISDHSQWQLLGKLYRDAAWRIFLAVFFAFELLIFLNKK